MNNHTMRFSICFEPEMDGKGSYIVLMSSAVRTTDIANFSEILFARTKNGRVPGVKMINTTERTAADEVAPSVLEYCTDKIVMVSKLALSHGAQKLHEPLRTRTTGGTSS